ncbi:MAG TPA: GGDEF domain-containing protein [Pseudomonas xinjiangensis]|uniref:diguanylate cyclase n=2 Tax=root TaxID=1 RepID=A0A7V1FR21_9GAMM|nr:GGDEF domain-containing protein [Halopseudomonas xinjiangensis]HEC47720.1 GGDEF domain-containing protein [Halopseudomonas xinjiangensis]
MRKIWIRLNNDFQLSIITLVGVCSLVGITPYAFFRLLEGNWVVGLVDTVLVTSTALAVGYAWKTGETVRPGQLLAFIYSIGTILVSIKLGVNGLFWFYTLILFNFFVVSPAQSITATLTALFVLCIYGLMYPGELFESHYQLTSFTVTCLIASFFAFVFASRGRHQRRQLSELARIDPLTGTGNRRTMDDELDLAFADHFRYGVSYGLLVLDLDHFKAVNDRYGHKAGDAVLIDFVRVVNSACRQSDRLFRLGGEEFVLLMPRVDAHGLGQAAEHITQTVAQRLHSPGGAVTVSIGGCLLTTAYDSCDSWLQTADEALYEAKRRGRNMSVISGLGTKADNLVPDSMRGANAC